MEENPKEFLDAAREHNNRGVMFHRNGDPDAAGGEYTEAVRLHPANATAMNNLGLLRARQSRFSAAIALYEKAIETTPAAAWPTQIPASPRLLPVRAGVRLAHENASVEGVRAGPASPARRLPASRVPLQ